MSIPEEYIVHKFYQYAGYPRYKKISNTYEGGCCMCREGSSWGRKRRLYYIVADIKICCHNCGWYSSPEDWVKQVAGLSWVDMIKESEEYDHIPGLDTETRTVYHVDDLPSDSIDLFDTYQLRFYSNNQHVKSCLDTIASRRLDTACNRPKSLYTTLKDRTHKNRLIIPFYDTSGKIVHYQSRQVHNDGKPKYLSKTNSDKTVFNIENLKQPNHIFICEGPIDSFFIKNSIAIAGIQQSSSEGLTEIQQQQLKKFFLSERVWVLDNDATGRIKSKQLLKRGHRVFIWPNQFKHFKDINELAVYMKRDEISEKFLLSNTQHGVQGIVRLQMQR